MSDLPSNTPAPVCKPVRACPRSYFFVWFRDSRTWVLATYLGARTCYVDGTSEVAYGRRKPKREGVDDGVRDKEARRLRWLRLEDAIRRDQLATHRTSSI